MPPIDEPKNNDVFITFAVGSVANNGKSWMNVAKQVNTAAKPTRLKIKVILSYAQKNLKIYFIIIYLWNPATSCGRSVICIRFATVEPIALPRPVHNII